MRIAIIGSGYVGLVTGTCLASVGHHVICVDSLPQGVDAINQGKPPFYEPGLEQLLVSTLQTGRLKVTTNVEESVAVSEVTFIAVGTPQGEAGIDLSYMTRVADQVGNALRRTSGYHVVAVKSTVVPGTTDTLVRNKLEAASGLKVGQFGLTMNPEFLREGMAVSDFMNPDRIVIGQWDEQSGRVLDEVYRPFECTKVFTALRNAELVKYTSNCFLATLISFSNEIAAICEAVPGTDVDEIMEALYLDQRLTPTIDNKRVVPGMLSYLRAGSGFGGSCLPKDVHALRAFAEEQGVTTHLLSAVISVNEHRPPQVVSLAEEVIGSLSGRTAAVLGLAFKPGTSDVRESPALSLIDYLLSKNVSVRGYDPKALGEARARLDGRVELCDTPESAVSEADVAVICTAWPEFAEWDWHSLAKSMRRPVIVDGRNALRGVPLPEEMIYISIGKKAEPQSKR